VLVPTGFWWGDLRERGHVEDPGVCGSVTLRLVFVKEDGDGDWYDLAQDRAWCLALVNSITNLRIP
jgi:hypothetical protein